MQVQVREGLEDDLIGAAHRKSSMEWEEDGHDGTAAGKHHYEYDH